MKSIIATFLAAGVIAGGGYYVDVDDSTMSGPLNAAGQDIIDVDDSYQTELTSDTLPRVRVESGQNAWPRSTTAANYVGANHVESVGMGARIIEITNVANMAGDALAVSVSAQGVVTTTTKTEGVASPNGWPACAAMTAAQCALGLYNLLNGAGAISGVYALCTDATCSDNKVFVGCSAPACSMLSIAYTSGGSIGATVTQRTDGYVMYPGGKLKLLSGDSLASGNTLKSISGGLYVQNLADTISAALYANTLGTSSSSGGTLGLTGITGSQTFEVQFSSTAAYAGAKDVGIKRASAGLVGLTDGAGNVVQTANYGRLGSASITANSAAAQTIFTVPAGRMAYPTRVVVRDASAAISAAIVGFGFDANCTDWLTNANLTAMSGATISVAFAPANAAATVEGPAAAVFCLKTSTPEGAADTVVVDVFGELL